MTILYLEPFGGMAGDMLLAALLDLDHDAFGIDDLRDLAASLVPGECTLEREEVHRGAFRATLLRVETAESAHPPCRHLGDHLALLEESPLREAGRERAAAVLRRLAEAEARVHGVSIEGIHFHEVGAVDTLIDVCGAVLALERLGVEEVRAAVPFVGGGTIRGSHGEMPVPAPGTAEILRGVPQRHGPGGERMTPTGAALLVELASEIGAPLELIPTAVGYGAGRREDDTGPANLLRVQLGREKPSGASRRRVSLLEFNLDDATGEEVGFLLGELRRAGALEAWSVPVQMKKDRPGIVISALARDELRGALESAAFTHSPTLGLRWSACERVECEREILDVDLGGDLAGRSVRVKRRHRPDGAPATSSLDLSPEHDDLARLARETGRSLRELEERAIEAARRMLDD